jgi:hypothetical protein
MTEAKRDWSAVMFLTKQVLTYSFNGAHSFKHLRIPTFLDNQSPELAEPLFARDGIGILLFSRSLSKMPLAAADKKKSVSGCKSKKNEGMLLVLDCLQSCAQSQLQALVRQSNLFLTSSPGRAPSRSNGLQTETSRYAKTRDVMTVFQTGSLSGH